MANSKSVAKRARSQETARKRHMALRSKLRTYIKKVVKALGAGDLEQAKSCYRDCVPIIDTSVNKGLIHANKAARHKRNLNHALRKAQAAQNA